MRCYISLFALATFCVGIKALTITSPSAESYWVQFSTNTIAWGFSSGDPDVVTLQIINPTSRSFAGPFAIAEYVKTSLKSYDVTNVTLSVLDGYQVQMVNSTNNTQVLATSGSFSVRIGGTPQAPVTFAPGTGASTSGTSNSSNSANNTSANPTSTSRNNTNSFRNNGTASGKANSHACHFEAPILSGLFLGFSTLLVLFF